MIYYEKFDVSLKYEKLLSETIEVVGLFYVMIFY